MGGACGTCGRQERGIQVFDVETRGKESLGRPRRRWEDNIKMDLRAMGWGMSWIVVAQGRVHVYEVMNLRVK